MLQGGNTTNANLSENECIILLVKHSPHRLRSERAFYFWITRPLSLNLVRLTRQKVVYIQASAVYNVESVAFLPDALWAK